MLAVLNPADSPFMFFTARKDDSGRHLFAADGDEQNRNQELIDSGADLSEYDSAYMKYLTNPIAGTCDRMNMPVHGTDDKRPSKPRWE